jgi:PAS domain S-box-containing protein
LKASRSYQSITFVDAAGREAVKVDWSGRVRKLRSVEDQPLFARLRAVGSQGSIDIEGPFTDQYGNILFSTGIYKTDQDIGKFGGAVIIDYNLEEFFNYAGRIKIFGKNPIWLFAPDGSVLKRQAGDQSGFDPRGYFAKGFQRDPLLTRVDDGMLVYQDLSIIPDRPLLRLAISIPSSLLLRDMRSVLRFFFLVFAASIVLISVIAYYLARYLSTPIIELAAAASRIARGERSAQVRVKATGEVQMLVDSFNRMAEDLEKTTVSRDYVDNIINNMVDTLIVASPDGRIIRVNAAACVLLKYDEEELVGRPLDLVIVHAPGTGENLVDELMKETIYSGEMFYRVKDGGRVPVLFSSSVMFDTQQKLAGIVCVAQDITERKRAEAQLKGYSEELAEINEELKTFAYIVSHDLRAPLVNIKGFSDELLYSIEEIKPVLEKHLVDIEEGQRRKYNLILEKDIPEALKFIGSSVRRMDNLINAILKLSRAGLRKLNPEPLQTEEFVQTILHTLAHQIDTRRITVTLGRLPDLVADRIAVEQIFGNLLDNAVKYLEPGRPGRITISADCGSEEVVFRIRDNGRGMSKEDIPKAFEIFRRVGARMLRRRHGPCLCEDPHPPPRRAHLVRVRARRRDDLQLFASPVRRATRRAAASGREAMSVRENQAAVLLVEDDPGHALLIEKNLRRAGLASSIVVLDDGGKAADYLLKQGDYALSGHLLPPFVLLDLDLPVLNGLQVLKLMKSDERTKRIPVIVLTSRDNPREIAQCYELGCNLYVTKPVEYDRFSDAIQRLGTFLSIVKTPEKE